MEILIILLLMAAVALLFFVLFLVSRVLRQSNSNGIAKEFYEKMQSENQVIREIMIQQQKIQSESSLSLSSALKDSLHKMGMELLKNNSDAQSRMQQTII